MAKRFNTTGPCIPSMHYMVDISSRLAQTVRLIEQGDYFTINRPRQYGKTTMLVALARALKGEYIIIDSSFEGADDELFSTQKAFATQILDVWAQSVEGYDERLSALLKELQKGVKSFKTLSTAITRLADSEPRGVVLLIDEVDQSSNSPVFLKFLGLLRNKYIERNKGHDRTFQSVVLAGVHDIKNLKLKIRDQKDAKYNSPWNIAVDYDVDMAFQPADIATMLAEYLAENPDVAMDAPAVSQRIHEWTCGYPFLVSKICLTIDTKLARDWTEAGVDAAVKLMMDEKSTLFDDLIKNVENNPAVKEAAERVLFGGERVPFDNYVFEEGLMYGVFARRDGSLAIHNRVFETRLYNYLIGKRMFTGGAGIQGVETTQFTDEGRLDMELVLVRFAEHMHEQFRPSDVEFYERHGRLLFLTFIRPIVNGRGFFFVESETRNSMRMDVVVTYGPQRFVVELKLWYGQAYLEKGEKQLAAYLDAQGLDEGYLLTFSLGKMPEALASAPPAWREMHGKRIFEAVA